MISVLSGLGLGLAMATDTPNAEVYPAKQIVAWEDGAVIERPFMDRASEYELMNNISFRNLILETSGLPPHRRNILVYKTSNFWAIVLVGVYDNAVKQWPPIGFFFIANHSKALNRPPGGGLTLPTTIAARLAWLINYLNISSKQTFKLMDEAERIMLSNICSEEGLLRLIKIGTPDYMDSYESTVAMIGDASQSITRLPEEQFQKMFGESP
jgi:hypothetical protein